MNLIAQVFVPFKDAFIDALKNTFNLKGRTRPKGFWLYVLPQLVLLCFWNALEIRLPPWVALYYLALVGIPLAGLFARRIHDSATSPWGGWLSVVLPFAFVLYLLIVIVIAWPSVVLPFAVVQTLFIGAFLIQLLLMGAFLIFPIIVLGVLGYFFFRLCSPSVEDNCYGRKPVDCLTTR